MSQVVLAPTAVVVPILAAVAAVIPGTWRLTRPLSTLVHEAGHTLIAVLGGRKVHAVKLFHHGGGCTTHSGAGGSAMVATAAAGYLAPPALGLAITAALLHDVAARVLILALLPVVALLLVLSRNVFGALVTVLVLGGLTALLRLAAPPVQQGVVVALAAFLLVAGLRSVLDLIVLLRRGSRGNDAAMLSRMTGIPAMLWALGFLAFSLGAIYLSGAWVLPTVA
jgi:hypothetical protein